jgi:hypothetical protein
VTEASEADGILRLYAFITLAGTPQAADAYVSVGIPKQSVVAEANRALARNLAGLGLVALLGFMAAWIGGNLFILRQVNALVWATKRLSSGDLGTRTGLPPGPGEMNQLAQAFDAMAESLERYQEQRIIAEQRKADLERAAQIQAELLPREIPKLPGFELAARCVPAREVGGDFYDWQEPATGILTLTLGDVMGKGMPAALLVAAVRAALRAIAYQNSSVVATMPFLMASETDLPRFGNVVTLFHSQLIQSAAHALEPDLERAGSFVTLFHAQLNVMDRRLDYVDAGHGCVFVRRAKGSI